MQDTPTRAEVSSHDVMISYKSDDQEVALKIRDHLEKAGIRCWMAPASVQPEENYQIAIGNAIKICRAVVLVFSGVTEESKDVKQEMTIAFQLGKPIIPFRIAHAEPGELVYVLANKHWLEAIPPGTAHFVRLEERILSILNRKPSGHETPRQNVHLWARFRKLPLRFQGGAYVCNYSTFGIF